MAAGQLGDNCVMKKANVIAFRTDASLSIGSGHVMRCLTLADALRAQGEKCYFVSRELPGHLFDVIRQRGYSVSVLPDMNTPISMNSSSIKIEQPEIQQKLAHSQWLGCDWKVDAAQTSSILTNLQPEWLITDHYSLAMPWEMALKSHYQKLMVIDDLADRSHMCDVLLDQNLVESMDIRYEGKVPAKCCCMLGPQYAIVRPEFSALRLGSLARRKVPKLNRLLIFMGGSDAENETSKVVAGVKLSKKSWDHIDVVVGQNFPALQSLKDSLVALPSAKLHVQTSEMAKLMAAADLAVTAGGSVSWEKCILGLPSLVAIEGENQRPIVAKLHKLGALRAIGQASNLDAVDYAMHLDRVQESELPAMVYQASSVCDGSGVKSVLKTIKAYS